MTRHHPILRLAQVIATAVLAAWLAGCANVPDGAGALMRPAAQVAFEKQQLAQAKRHVAEGELAQAAFHWEVLTVLRPDVPGYAAQLAQTRAQIEKNASELLRSARLAQQKGAQEEATQRYLAVLALAPEDAAITQAASQALRAIERDRVKREQLGKYSSRQLQPRMPAVPRKAAPMPMQMLPTSKP